MSWDTCCSQPCYLYVFCPFLFPLLRPLQKRSVLDESVWSRRGEKSPVWSSSQPGRAGGLDVWSAKKAAESEWVKTGAGLSPRFSARNVMCLCFVTRFAKNECYRRREG